MVRYDRWSHYSDGWLTRRASGCGKRAVLFLNRAIACQRWHRPYEADAWQGVAVKEAREAARNALQLLQRQEP